MSPTTTDTFDVIICGCGPTGAVLSANLGRLRVNHVVLEREPDITTDPRGIALDEDGIRIAQGVGIYEALFKDVGKRKVPVTSPSRDSTRMADSDCTLRQKRHIQALCKLSSNLFPAAMGIFQFIQGGKGLDVRPFLQFDYKTVRSLEEYPSLAAQVVLIR